MSKELIEQLRDLANCRHDDLSIGCEAADRIEELERQLNQPVVMSEWQTLVQERDHEKWLRERAENFSNAIMDQRDVAQAERDQLREQLKTLQSAIKNLRDVKGRHHSEIAYKRLIEVLAATEPK